MSIEMENKTSHGSPRSGSLQTMQNVPDRIVTYNELIPFINEYKKLEENAENKVTPINSNRSTPRKNPRVLL